MGGIYTSVHLAITLEAPQRLAQGGERTDGQTEVCADGKMFSFPLYSTLCPLWFPPGPLPKKGKV